MSGDTRKPAYPSPPLRGGLGAGQGQAPETPQRAKRKRIRKHEVKLRLSDDEWLRFKSWADQLGQPVAAAVRELVIGDGKTRRSRRPRRRRTSPVDPQLLYQLAAIGNNVNQLARWANSLGPNADALRVLIELRGIESQLRALLNAHKVS